MKRFLVVALLALAAASARAQTPQPSPQPQPGSPGGNPFQPQSGGLNFAQPSPFGQQPSISSAPVTSTSPAVNVSTAPKPFDIHASTPGFYLFGGPEPAVATSTGPKKFAKEPLILSGAVLTPTAYRAWNWPGLGPSIDINAAYYIGRLYGVNKLEWTTSKTNYIDRLGVWFLSVDGKLQIQHETRHIPAVAAGAETIYTFRDSPQPSVATPGVTVKVSAPTTKVLTGAYLVGSKKVIGQYWSVGFERGNAGNRPSYLSEFLTPESLTFSGHPGETVSSDDTLFASVILFPATNFPVKVEYMRFVAAPLHPYLMNFRIGSLLHLNFDISYLKFDGGYDLLGMFGFRYSLYPKR